MLNSLVLYMLSNLGSTLLHQFHPERLLSGSFADSCAALKHLCCLASACQSQALEAWIAWGECPEYYLYKYYALPSFLPPPMLFCHYTTTFLKWTVMMTANFHVMPATATCTSFSTAGYSCRRVSGIFWLPNMYQTSPISVDRLYSWLRIVLMWCFLDLLWILTAEILIPAELHWNSHCHGKFGTWVDSCVVIFCTQCIFSHS